ncbi:MAG: YgfZ/GcvT domain-containing protein [Alcanivorax sp.]
MSWSDFIATQDLTDSAQAPYLSHCDHLAVIRAHGEEAGHYLQGQVSCDLREVDQQCHRTGMHLTLKGRGLVSVRIVRDGDDYLLLCPAGLSEAVIKALMKYRLRAKVEFTVDPNLVVLGLAGHLPASAPDHGNSAETDQGLWLRYPFTDHALLIVPQDRAEPVWQTLASDRALTRANGWQLADIDAGEGMVYPGAEDLFLPQVLNYDVTAGVNFKKGFATTITVESFSAQKRCP